MSYLNQLFNKPGEPKIQSFGSIESLLKTIIPPNELKENSPQDSVLNEKITVALNEANDAIVATKKYIETNLK